MQLTNLPLELLLAIVFCLDLRSVLRCRQVCHLLKTVADDDVCARYKTELNRAGMEDGPPSTLTPLDRLAMLRERQRAWRRLEWKAVDEFSMPICRLWALNGGVFGLSERKEGEGEHTLVFRQLQSVIRGLPAKQWKIDTGMNVRNFVMDPAQDLLGIVEEITENSEIHCRIHIRSLATGQPHSLAAKAIISALLSHPGRYLNSTQLCADHLGILVDTDENVIKRLFVWNWKTGVLRLHVRFSVVPSFAFLTSSHVMLCVYPSRNMPQAPAMGVDGAQLVIVDLDTASDEPVHFADLDYLCKFHYPALADSSIITHMHLRSDPGPGFQPHASLKVPFHVGRQDRLFVITIGVDREMTFDGARRTEVFNVSSFVLASTLFTKLTALGPGERKRAFAWDEWGPDGSRLLLTSAGQSMFWVWCVFGTTYVMTLRQGSNETIVTFDFNQLDARRSRASACETFVMEPKYLDQGLPFKEAVVTRLRFWRRQTEPFAELFAEEEGNFNAAVISRTR